MFVAFLFIAYAVRFFPCTLKRRAKGRRFLSPAVPEKAHDSQRAKSKRMTFEEIGISVGAVLHFKEDPSVTVEVADAKSWLSWPTVAARS